MPSFPFTFPATFSVPNPVTGVVDVDHEEIATSRVAMYLREKPRFMALLRALVTPAAELEQVIADMYVLRSIDSATGVNLDAIGKIIKCPRESHTDVDYRRFLKAQIKVNLSSGTIPDLINIADLITSYTIAVRDEYPAALALCVQGPMSEDTATSLVRLLKTARAGGVRLVLEWSPELFSTWLVGDTGTGDGTARGIGALD